jgi:ribose/xylose/arabinose/galactoside ABC-type transport system permease subunit
MTGIPAGMGGRDGTALGDADDGVAVGCAGMLAVGVAMGVVVAPAPAQPFATTMAMSRAMVPAADLCTLTSSRGARAAGARPPGLSAHSFRFETMIGT